MRPESLSGIWETSSGHGSAIGIHLELDTTIPSDGDKQSWVPQSWQNLQVGVFKRKGAEIQLGEESGFSDSRRGGNLTFDQGRLQLHFVSPWTDTPSVDLDLVQQAGGCWDGRLHRGEFDSHVTLCRPSTSLSGMASPLVGTWAENSNLGEGCIHIAEQAPGEFTGWSDDIQLPGTVRSCIDGVSKPVAVFQRFGELRRHRAVFRSQLSGRELDSCRTDPGPGATGSIPQAGEISQGYIPVSCGEGLSHSTWFAPRSWSGPARSS